MSDHLLTTVEQLEAHYGLPSGAAVFKEIDHINAQYRTFIEAAPFFALSTVGPEGVDCSPRGDAPGFVRVADERTLMIPDRRGNNRIDSLRNIVRDPRVSLLFLIPGVGETFRVIGRANISTDPALLDTFVFAGKTPRAVIVVDVERVYFQCSKAIDPLKTVGSRKPRRPQEPAEQRHHFGGDHQGRDGRGGVRPRVSGEVAGDDLLRAPSGSPTHHTMDFVQITRISCTRSH